MSKKLLQEASRILNPGPHILRPLLAGLSSPRTPEHARHERSRLLQKPYREVRTAAIELVKMISHATPLKKLSRKPSQSDCGLTLLRGYQRRLSAHLPFRTRVVAPVWMARPASMIEATIASDFCFLSTHSCRMRRSRGEQQRVVTGSSAKSLSHALKNGRKRNVDGLQALQAASPGLHTITFFTLR